MNCKIIEADLKLITENQDAREGDRLPQPNIFPNSVSVNTFESARYREVNRSLGILIRNQKYCTT